MKKLFLEPEAVVYEVNAISHLMNASMTGGDTGTVTFSNDPVNDQDPETFELASRKDNGGGGGNVLDNIW